MTSLRQLECFVAVAEEQHFRRAAERLHFATSHLSHQIRQLEADLGVSLLTRTTRHVTLTPAGEALFKHASGILDAVASMRLAVQEAAAATDSAVSFLYSTGTGWTTRALLTEYSLRYPDVTFTLRRGTEPEIVTAIRDGDHTAGILNWDVPELESLLLRRSHTRFLGVPPDSSLAGRSTIDIRELDGVEIILPTDDVVPHYSNIVAELFASLEVDAKILRLPMLDEWGAINIIGSGVGTVLMTKMTADIARANGLGVIPLTGPTPYFDEWLTCRDRDSPPSIASLFEVAEELQQRWSTDSADSGSDKA